MIESRIENQIPLVSIIIPVYNKVDFVGKTLDSALEQTYPQTEIIVVNDGSTDGSFEILKAFFEKYSDRIVLIDQENQGVSAATNKGIQSAKGEYIQFLDADDLISTDKIESQVQLLLKASQGSIATCEWINFKKDIQHFIKVPYGIFQDFESGLDLLLRFWNMQEMMAISSYLIHRSLIAKAGPWKESLLINQDGEFFTRVLLHADKVIYDSKGKIFYRSPGENNVSQQRTENAMKSLLESYYCYEKEVLKFEDSKRVRIALKKVYQKFIYDVFPQFPDLIKMAEVFIDNLGLNEATYIGGPKFQQFSKLVGFKNALRLKRLTSFRVLKN